MKAIINETATPKTKFPRLMKNKNGDVIMITDTDYSNKGHGFVIAGPSVGRYSDQWHLNVLEDFHGEVVLSSESC